MKKTSSMIVPPGLKVERGVRHKKRRKPEGIDGRREKGISDGQKER